jgi:glycosyltransferase involved in cell wall biosynthesis
MAIRPVVLVLIKGLGIGGAERLISEAAPYWDRERFDYRVAYLLPWKDQLVTELELHGVEVAMLGSQRGAGPGTIIRLRRHIAETGTALVHAHLPSAGILARLASQVPVVYTEHNLSGSYRPLTRILNRFTYGLNSSVTAVSEAVAGSITGHRGPTVRVIPNGVAVSVTAAEAAAARDELGVTSTGNLVVHVGNIRPHKGHTHLIGAARWLAHHRPGVALVSIGGEKHPGDLERVRRLASAEGVDGTIRFLGRRTDARAFLAAADVVVNPSDFEGLPVVLLEAMALGRPVVATDVGGVASLVIDGISGLLVPPGDPETLGAAVARVLDDPPFAKRLGEAGRDVVEREYGLEPMVRAFEAIYEEVLSG